MCPDIASLFSRKKDFKDYSDILPSVESEKRVPKSKGSIARRISMERQFYEREKRIRGLKYSGIKDALVGKRGSLDFIVGDVDSSMVHSAIKSRVNEDNRVINEFVDEMVFILFDSKSVSVDAVEDVANRAIDFCYKSDSVSVCSTLLEVNDIILFANEKFGFVGDKKLRDARRFNSLRVNDRLHYYLSRSLHRFDK